MLDLALRSCMVWLKVKSPITACPAWGLIMLVRPCSRWFALLKDAQRHEAENARRDRSFLAWHYFKASSPNMSALSSALLYPLHKTVVRLSVIVCNSQRQIKHLWSKPKQAKATLSTMPALQLILVPSRQSFHCRLRKKAALCDKQHCLMREIMHCKRSRQA